MNPIQLLTHENCIIRKIGRELVDRVIPGTDYLKYGKHQVQLITTIKTSKLHLYTYGLIYQPDIYMPYYFHVQRQLVTAFIRISVYAGYAYSFMYSLEVPEDLAGTKRIELLDQIDYGFPN